jgi:hypothetical protein
MQTNPLNSIETTLGNLYGNDPLGIKNVAYKIRTGLGHEGFTVVKTAHVDRLRTLLLAVSENPDNESSAFDTIHEALEIVEGWK